jgi:polygalacturonase
MRGPKGRPVGTLKRVLISNVTSSNAGWLPSIIAGLPDHPVEDVKISDVFLHQKGGAPEAMAHLVPPANEDHYPEPNMFGDLPASGFFIRHARNVEMTNVEVALDAPDPRPAFRIENVDGADFFRVKAAGGPVFSLKDVRAFSLSGSGRLRDRRIEETGSAVF